MSKLEKIKMMLSELLEIEKVEFASATTEDGFAIFWEGELAEGVAVFTEDEEGNRVPLADGTYRIGNSTEKIVFEIENGIVKSYVVEEVPIEPEQTEEPEEEPQDEPQEEENADENVEEPEVENPTNEGEETDTEAIVKIREEINELYSIVDELKREIAELKGKPAAMSAQEEFENITKKEKNLKGAARYTQYIKK